MNRQQTNDAEIDFVYFDLGNVLLTFDPELACRNLADRFSLEMEEVRSAVYDSGLQDRFEHGDVTGAEFAEAVRKQVGRSADEMPTDQVLDGVSDMFTPIDSMGPVLNSVRDRGLGVGLLSNTCHAHWDWICRQDYFLKTFRFDVTILSFEVGSMKPAETIYRISEERAGVEPGRLLFLDDKPENVAAAHTRKWKAAQCIGGEEAIEALRSHRVLGRKT
ncbi:MAG: HAD family hydrolase [Rubripirellula sp.]